MHSPLKTGTEPLVGLAPLARLGFAGQGLTEWQAKLLNRISRDDNDANALMDLSTVLQLMGQRQSGLSVQALALNLKQLYSLPSSTGSAAVRLLAFVSPGDLAENNQLEFLVERSDIALKLLYVAPDLPFPTTIPPHDVAMVAICETDWSRPLLKQMETVLKNWPRPVLCSPDRIARLSRDGACALLKSQPGIVMPVTTRVTRQMLIDIGRSEIPVELSLPDGSFPLIIRPVDSQKGRGLARIENPSAIVDYLAARPEEAFYVSRYVDYRSADGQFRKYRILLIDDRPYVCHMAISDNWVVHYMSAGMVENPVKRAEEARLFENFDSDFASHHHNALHTIAKQLELEYVGIDCGETPDGQLLIFEVDSGMTVHAMDPVDLFPYKQPQMQKVFRAFRQLLMKAAGKEPGNAKNAGSI